LIDCDRALYHDIYKQNDSASLTRSRLYIFHESTSIYKFRDLVKLSHMFYVHIH